MLNRDALSGTYSWRSNRRETVKKLHMRVCLALGRSTILACALMVRQRSSGEVRRIADSAWLRVKVEFFGADRPIGLYLR